jgi:cysteine-rich repeat protein
MNAKHIVLGVLLLNSCFLVNRKLTECERACTKDGNSVIDCASNGDFIFVPCATDESEVCNTSTNTCGACGDGNISGGEDCDDSNQEIGDGCDSQCQFENNVVCGNGVTEFTEECDDGNNNNADTCEGDCTLPKCGNFVTDPNQQETCDDGNTTNGDGCSEDCRLEISDCGNSIIEAGESCDDGNRINGDACENDCTLPVCGNTIVDIGEQCDFGDINNNDGCSASCQDEICGDGITQSNEACDDENQIDNDACTNLCTISLVCGNNVLNAGEACDDGNTINGDGCSSACLSENCGDGIVQGIEQCDNGGRNSNLFAGACRLDCKNPRCGDNIVDFNEDCDNNSANCVQCQIVDVDEEERNNSISEANVIFAQNPPLQIRSEVHIKGLRQGVDIFRVEFAQPTSVRIELFDEDGVDCDLDGDPVLTLLNINGFVFKDNLDSGINNCAAIVTRLLGVFYIQLDKQINQEEYKYVLEVVPLADMNTEIEFNNTIGGAADEITGPDVVVLGNYPNVNDIDFYQIEIPTNGLSVRAQIFEGDSGETCESNEIDSELALFDANGSLLDFNDDNENFCSLLDGTGTIPKNPAVGNLAAGTYFLRVDSSPNPASASGQIFEYRLAVTIR